MKDADDNSPVSIHTLSEVIRSLKSTALTGKPLDSEAVARVALRLDGVKDILDRNPPSCPALTVAMSENLENQVPDHIPCEVCGLRGDVAEDVFDRYCTFARSVALELEDGCVATPEKFH